MIHREDMLELTRRMTPKRNCFDRIAGAYLDGEGEIDGTFQTHFLKLPASEQERNLAIAKTIPFSKTNDEIKDYHFDEKGTKPGSMWQLLMAMRECGLKNDALMETFYEVVSEQALLREDYAIFVFHGVYDVPVKAMDKERLDESEEVYDFLICTVSKQSGNYEAEIPECGFLFPAFSGRSGDTGQVDIFYAEAGGVKRGALEELLQVTGLQ